MDLSGTRIADRYAVKDLIAEGGMSYVYHATDMKSGESVVVKVLKSSAVSTRLEDIVRFQGVTDALSRIDHPNVVRIIETGTFNVSYGSQTWYIVMEPVPGACYFDNPLARGIFSEGTGQLLDMFFSHAVVVIENLMLRARLANRAAVERLARKDEQWVDRAVCYLEENYYEEFHREKISGLLGVNTDYLGRVFKAGTGKTMREYLNEVRVREAVKRLADESARIIDIAMDSGFNSMRTFHRIFYRIMGLAPAEYRDKMGKR